MKTTAFSTISESTCENIRGGGPNTGLYIRLDMIQSRLATDMPASRYLNQVNDDPSYWGHRISGTVSKY
jgi:hypothetical protein